jgi:soluble lytic murein transglycosylase-like protein
VPPTHAHVVRRGETVWGIATAAGVDPAAVLALNALDGGAILLPGRRLLLPGPGPRSRHASATEAAPQDAVTVAAAANRIALARRPAPSRARTRALVAATARRLGVDPALAQAVAYQESGFRHHVVSSANAVGVMQVVPSSGRWASDLVGRPLDLLDAHDNVVAGVAILAALTAGRSEGTAIAAYYQGLTSVARDGLYPDTRRYVANVRTLAARFRARTPGPVAGRT